MSENPAYPKSDLRRDIMQVMDELEQKLALMTDFDFINTIVDMGATVDQEGGVV